MRLHRWRALRRLVLGGDVAFARGLWRRRLEQPGPGGVGGTGVERPGAGAADRRDACWRLANRIGHMRQANTRTGAARNIIAHYDLGNDFFAAWLDGGMTCPWYPRRCGDHAGPGAGGQAGARGGAAGAGGGAAGAGDRRRLGRVGRASAVAPCRRADRGDAVRRAACLGTGAAGARRACGAAAVAGLPRCPANTTASCRSRCWRRWARRIGRSSSAPCATGWPPGALPCCR